MRRVSKQEWENEHMHNPMTEGEALAVEAGGIVRKDGRPGIDRLWDSQWVNIVNSPEVLGALRNFEYEDAVNIAVRMTEQKMAENFTAHTAASGGEVVAWQERYLDIDTGEWSQWRYCAKYIYEAHLNFRVPEIGARALYTAPPSAVPADALERLVEKWLLHSDPYHGKCADELAALIPKGADHEQR